MPDASGSEPELDLQLLEPHLGDAAGEFLAYMRGKSERDRAIVAERIISDRSTLVELGDRFGVTRERIRQVEKRLAEAIERFMAGHAGERVLPLVVRVRTELGTAVPEQAQQIFFNELFKDFQSDMDRLTLADFCLWAAGPYRWREGWGTTKHGLEAATRATLLARLDEKGRIQPAVVRTTLSSAGIRHKFHNEWMERLGFWRQDDGWLPRLSSIPARAEQVLRYRGIPMTAEELLPLVDCESVRSLRSRLLEDSRVKRINRQGQFALREWVQYDEYSGIAEEIAQEIALQGGLAESQHLIEVISVRYGVKSGSVAAYLAAPMFVKTDDGRVRLREPDELRVVRSDPQRCAGLYRIGDRWVFRIRVNSDTLRGSGRPFPVAAATTLGCQPGEKKVFKSPCSEVVVSWPVGSASGPNIGSIRPDVEALKGEIDDYMFLTFDDGSVQVRLLPSAGLEGVSNEIKLAMLVGLEGVGDAARRLQEVASAIGFQAIGRRATLEDVHAWLMQRNEVDLGRMLSLPGLEEDGDILSYLEGALRLS